MTITALVRNKTKQTDIQAHIFKKPLISVERSPVLYCYNTAHAQTAHFTCSSECIDNVDFRK